MNTPTTDAQVEFIRRQLAADTDTGDHADYALDLMARLCRALETALRLVTSEAVPVGDGAYVSLERSVVNRAREVLKL
jgi:hypothetical protein